MHFKEQILDFLTFLESSRVILVNVIELLIMSAKVATLDLLKKSNFWNKKYDVINSVYDITNKILSRGWNHIVDVVMWPKFGNPIISMKEVIVTSIL